MLIGLAALYAYALNERKEGEWVWHDKANACLLANIYGTNIKLYLLQEIIIAWCSKNTEEISRWKEMILNQYNLFRSFKDVLKAGDD